MPHPLRAAGAPGSIAARPYRTSSNVASVQRPRANRQRWPFLPIVRRGRITPCLRHSALRAAALRATFSGAFAPPSNLLSARILPRQQASKGQFRFWWRGEDYSMPAAFRPPGRRASRDVLRRFRASVEPLVGSNPPPPAGVEGSIPLLVEGGGFEPPKAEPSDLQSDPFDRSGTPPKKRRYSVGTSRCCQQKAAAATSTWRGKVRLAVVASAASPTRVLKAGAQRPIAGPKLIFSSRIPTRS